jgi:cytochrome c biogenesis protein
MPRAGRIVSATRRHLLAEWRTLARMRTAVILLAIVAGMSIIATLLPQRALQPARAGSWIQAHQVLGPYFDRLGLFAVYESWPLLAAAALMYISLGNCVLTRGRALHQRWRRRLPRNPQFIGEAGSLVFHLSFFVLLAGILWGKAAGFTAFVDVLEGQSVVEARPSYDQVEEGLLFNDSQHQGFEVKVDSFQAQYFDSGKPKLFNSHVRVFDQGRKVAEQDIQVNQYLEYKGVKFYQASYGWAPVLRVTDPSGREVFNAPVLFFGDPQLADGIVKVPSAGPPGQQLGALMFFIPDVRDSGGGSVAGSAELRNPAIEYRLFKGDLQAGRAQNVYELDTSRMTQVATGGILMGQTADLPGGYKMTFSRVMQYTGLQVTHDPGVPIIWVSFALMLGGLLVRLYLRPLLESRAQRHREQAQLKVA